jgi:hypothetical protein
MPELDLNGKTTSFFEFWPTWAIYLPVVGQCLWLGLRHRSFTLPLLANPSLPLSGMVGIGKSELFEQATGECAEAILPWVRIERRDGAILAQIEAIAQTMSEKGLGFPLVGKPDIGCRGAGVKLLHDQDALLEYLAAYPTGSAFLLQKLASHEAEAGVFYVRHPHQAKGEIISMALKYTPYVVGDGTKTLRELIASDPRASELSHLYFSRHCEQLETVIANGRPYKLVFSASHCRGAVFRDANALITEALTSKIDAIMAGLPDFHYGRLDIKFADIEQLQLGQGLEVVEINSASSEPLHIWDRNTSYRDAIGALLFQYRTLFELGASQRERGHRPPSFNKLLRHWRLERQLTAQYPETD